MVMQKENARRGWQWPFPSRAIGTMLSISGEAARQRYGKPSHKSHKGT